MGETNKPSRMAPRARRSGVPAVGLLRTYMRLLPAVPDWLREWWSVVATACLTLAAWWGGVRRWLLGSAKQQGREEAPLVAAMRSRIMQALAAATGPEIVSVIQNPDGSLVVSPVPVYLWKGYLPNGEPFAFTTDTPALEYAGLIDPLTARVLAGKSGWAVIEHSPACQAAGVGCICEPSLVQDVVWEQQ